MTGNTQFTLRYTVSRQIYEYVNMSPVATESVLLSMFPHTGSDRHVGGPNAKSSNELEVHSFRRRLDKWTEENSVTNWTKYIRLRSYLKTGRAFGESIVQFGFCFAS